VTVIYRDNIFLQPSFHFGILCHWMILNSTVWCNCCKENTIKNQRVIQKSNLMQGLISNKILLLLLIFPIQIFHILLWFATARYVRRNHWDLGCCFGTKKILYGIVESLSLKKWFKNCKEYTIKNQKVIQKLNLKKILISNKILLFKVFQNMNLNLSENLAPFFEHLVRTLIFFFSINVQHDWNTKSVDISCSLFSEVRLSERLRLFTSSSHLSVTGVLKKLCNDILPNCIFRLGLCLQIGQIVCLVVIHFWMQPEW
jgi:hypothetical protein